MNRFAVILTTLLSLFSTPVKGIEAIPSNHIHFNGEVNDNSVNEATAAMDAAVKAGAKFLLVEINSPGGNVESGFGFVKAIESSPVPVICVVDGAGMSMAFAVLQSCHTRFATYRSVLLIHKPKIGGMFGGDDHSFENLADYLRALSEAMVQQCAHRMTIPIEEVRKRIDHNDWFMTAAEALQVGAVDGVVSSVAAVKVSYETLNNPKK